MRLFTDTKLFRALQSRPGVWVARSIALIAVAFMFASPFALPHKVVAQAGDCTAVPDPDNCCALAEATDSCATTLGCVADGGVCIVDASVPVPELPVILAPLFLLGAAGVAHRARKKKLASRKPA